MTARWNMPALLRRERGGFTLLELLVASALTVMIAALALSLVTNALGRWSRTQGTLTTEGQARTVLDQLEVDLQGACHRDDGNVWLAAIIQGEGSASGVWIDGRKPITASLDPVTENLAEGRFGVAGVWLRFFTAGGRADAGPAAPAAVSYQIIRRFPLPSEKTCHYLLYRSDIGAAETFANGFDLGLPAYGPAASPEGAEGSLATPGFRQILADNVIDFGVRLLGPATEPAAAGRELPVIFPLHVADREYRAGLVGADGARQPFPAVVDVMVRILTDDGARQIAALEAGQLAGDWWRIAQEHSRVFTRRIVLRTTPA